MLMNGKTCNHHYLHRLYTHCTDLHLFTFATSPRQCVNILQDSSLTSKNFPHTKFQTIDANRERPRKAHRSNPGAWSPKRGKGRNLTNRPHKDFEIPRSLGERAGGAERVIVAKSIKRSVRFSPGSYHVSVLETFKKFHIIFFFSLSRSPSLASLPFFHVPSSLPSLCSLRVICSAVLAYSVHRCQIAMTHINRLWYY